MVAYWSPYTPQKYLNPFTIFCDTQWKTELVKQIQIAIELSYFNLVKNKHSKAKNTSLPALCPVTGTCNMLTEVCSQIGIR